MSSGFRLLACAVLAFAAAPALAEAPQPIRFAANEGEVLEVDREEREITIHHGYLPELDMDPMSMVFKVADSRLLDRVRKGDRVKFKPGLVEGRFAIISIERIRRPRRGSQAKEPRQ